MMMCVCLNLFIYLIGFTYFEEMTGLSQLLSNIYPTELPAVTQESCILFCRFDFSTRCRETIEVEKIDLFLLCGGSYVHVRVDFHFISFQSQPGGKGQYDVILYCRLHFTFSNVIS